MSNPDDFVIENGVLKEYQGAGGDVVIPEGVTEISWFVFKGCTALTSVTIPDSVTSIGNRAFEYCTGLTSVTIPDSVTSIGSAAFENCTGLTSVTIPDSVTSIGSAAFEDCTGLTSVTIPDSVTSVGSDAFADTGYFNDPGNWQNGVLYIGNHLIKAKKSLSGNYEIKPGTVCIAESAFRSCTGLTSVTIPDSVTSISGCAFEDCTGLTSVTIGSSVTSIGGSAFYGCTGLTSVTIPSSVTSIEGSAFLCCKGLKRVNITDLASWCNISFSNNDSNPLYYAHNLYLNGAFVTELVIPDVVTRIGQYMFSNCTCLNSVTIPSSVTGIGKSAFYDCTSLTSVTIPSSVTNIEDSAFAHCKGLKRVNITNLAAWCSISFLGIYSGAYSNPLFYASKLYLNNEPVTDLVIPDGVTSISNYAFYGYSGLTSVTIPESVKEIGEAAFKECEKLSKVANLPLDVKLAKDAFASKYEYIQKNLRKDFPFLVVAFLSQSLKGLVKECTSYLSENPSATAQAMLDVLKGKGKDKHYQKASNFFLEHRKEIGDDLLKTLYEQAVTDKAKKTAESLKPLVKADTQPEATGGREIETFCRKIFIEQLLDETIKKQKINAQLFDTVKYKDNGEPAPAFVVKCAVIPYIDQLKENPKRISDYKWDYSRFTICKEADRAAAELEESSFQAMLTKLARISLEGSRYDCSHAYWSPAMLLPLCRYASGALVNDLASTMRREWVSWDQYGAKGRTAIIITRGALLLNDSREAMLFAEKEKCLDYYAQIRDTDADVLRSTRMIDFGFNADGKILYDLGSTVIEATLGDDLAISLYDTAAGKAVKSLPKRGAEEAKYNECAAAFAEFKKNYKKIVKARNDLLFESFLNGRAVKAKIWQEAYLGNPVLNKVARLIVWSQSGKTFTLGRDGLINSTGAAFILQKDYDIAVAHPIEMQDDDVARWQRYFTGKQLKQPFEQIWEPSLVKNGVDKDRYKGICIPYYRFLHQEKHGITVYDKNYHNDITIYLADCNARVKRVDWARHEISPDDRFEVASIVPKSQSRAANHILYYLDKCTIYGKLERDEVESLPDLNGYTAAQISAFLSFSIEHNAAKCTAVLLDYKNEHFADFSAMDEFTLDL